MSEVMGSLGGKGQWSEVWDQQKAQWCSSHWLDLGWRVGQGQVLDFGIFGPLTWLGHRPLFALKQATGCRQLANPCPVCCPGTELIEVAFTKVTDLEEQRQMVKTRAGTKGERGTVAGETSEQEVQGALNEVSYVTLHLRISQIIRLREPEASLGFRTSNSDLWSPPAQASGPIPGLPCRPGWGWAAG